MQQETPQTRFEEGFVDVAGVRVYYRHAGSGSPMLLIHGVVGSSADWRNNIDALAQQGSVYAIDLVNMGRSQRVGGLDATLGATAKRIVAVMDALRVTAADVAAHSHGGAVALMLAALYPTRVRRLILFAPANPYNRSSDPVVRMFSSRLGGLLAWIVPYLPGFIQREAIGGLYGGASYVNESRLQEIADCLRNPGSLRHVLSITRGWFGEEAKLKAALRRVKWTPTLLVWGDHDRTVSLTSGFRLKRKLRASELVVVPGGGHSVFEEAPDVANRAMMEWLERHPLPAAGLRHRPRMASVARRGRGAAGVRRLSPGT
jgi:4,5:9,10-diseco-3-hydroxy-5,9,17-trioxoandrosta-1(10),2-diene-4-oate hydrolase